MQWNGGADGDSLRGLEEAGDDADSGEDDVEVPDLMGGEQKETQGSADAVARDHGRLQWPAVDEDSSQNAEDGDGEHVRDLDAGNLLRSGVELEREDADDGKEREKVSEDRDDLRVPEPTHHGDAHHIAHRKRRGGLRADGWGRDRLG